MTLLVLASLAGAAVAAPDVLARFGWLHRCPRLAVLAWQVAPTTVVICVAVAVQTMVMPWHEPGDALCTLWRLCLDALVGAHGVAAQVMAWAGLLVAAVGLWRLGVAAVSLVRAAAQRRRHATLVRLVGRRRPEWDVTVVDHPSPGAYLIPGRSRQVVVTTGALDRLSEEELAAVLAHERAHARGRHHLLLAVTSLLYQAFPAVAVFGKAHGQVRRLVEMCADDDACREHSRLVLARALVTLATAATAPGMLAAAGGDAVARVHRLLHPPSPLPRPARLVIRAVLVSLPLAPLVMVLAVPAVPLLAVDLPLL